MKQENTCPDAKRQQLAKSYARTMRWFTILEWGIIAVIFLALIFSGISAALGHFLSLPQPWTSAAYFIIIAIILGIIMSPVDYYTGYLLPRRYGLSTETFRLWLADRAKAAALGLIMGLIVVIAVYWLMDNCPAIWWLWSAILLILLSLLLTRVAPTLLLSLFFKLERLQDSDLENRLVQLAERAGAAVCGVYVMNLSSKGTTANAGLAGLGRTRRIILTDTLLQTYSPDEIEVILAHELAHHIHRDITRMIILQGITVLLGLYLADLVLKASMIPLSVDRISDATAFPVLLLFLGVFSLVITPLANAFSRYQEAKADKLALKLSGNPGAFISSMTRLTDQNLSEASPARWVELLFYDHPPYTKRVNLALNYSEEYN